MSKVSSLTDAAAKTKLDQHSGYVLPSENTEQTGEPGLIRSPAKGMSRRPRARHFRVSRMEIDLRAKTTPLAK